VDNNAQPEQRLLAKALKTMEPLGLHFRVLRHQVRDGAHRTDADIDLRFGGRNIRYVVEVKCGLRPATLGAVTHQLATHKGAGSGRSLPKGVASRRRFWSTLISSRPAMLVASTLLNSYVARSSLDLADRAALRPLAPAAFRHAQGNREHATPKTALEALDIMLRPETDPDGSLQLVAIAAVNA